MLVYWIPKTPSTIPANASRKVVVGAIVLNSKKEILVVQEKIGKLRGIWKIPTGTVEEGENLHEAAVREVKEETGIDTSFEEVLAFREYHKSLFEKSSLLFLSMLHPLSSDIQIQELEIEAAQWMPFEEFKNQPINQKHEPFKYIVHICSAKMNKGYTGFSPQPLSSFFNDRLSYLYFNNRYLNQSSSSNDSNGS